MKTQTKKAQIACRLSQETLKRVKALTEGEDAPFESVSEYLYTLIISDLARREMNVSVAAYELMEALKDPKLRAEFKRMLKEDTE